MLSAAKRQNIRPRTTHKDAPAPTPSLAEPLALPTVMVIAMIVKLIAPTSKSTAGSDLLARTIRYIHVYFMQGDTYKHRTCTRTPCSFLCARPGVPRDTQSSHPPCRRSQSTWLVNSCGALVQYLWSRVLLCGARYRSTCLSHLSEGRPRSPRPPWVRLLHTEANRAGLRCTATLRGGGVLPRARKANFCAKRRLAVRWQLFLCCYLGVW